MERSSGLAGCTVVSRNHLAYARVACRSFLSHHPGARFFVLLADRNEGQVVPGNEPFELVELERLPIPDLPRFTFQYDILELNCAGKPYLLRHVLQQPGISTVLYLDSDTFVYRGLDDALRALQQHSIVLTPHLLGDVEEDGRKPGERHVMESGVYNAGFLGVRRDDNVERFLRWWSRRVYDQCVADTRQGLFVDQRWLDLVPGLFAGVHLLRHPGYNVGHWGLTHRQVSPGRDGLLVNGLPLALFHFSGLDVEDPRGISRHQDRFSLDDVPVLKPLFEEYAARVKEAGLAESRQRPYAYARFDNDVAIPRDARRLYWSLGDGVRRFGDPFQTALGASFWRWMVDDAHAASGVSRLWHHVYSGRPDLQRAFPDVFGKDRLPFLSWIIERGAWDHEVPQELVPSGPPLAAAPPHGRTRGQGRPDVPGVNVAGHAQSEKGLGEAMRALVRGLAAAGIDHCVVDETDEGSANRDRTLVGLLKENPYPVNLIQVNAPALPWFVHRRGPAFFRGRYNIGYWLWELPEFPEKFQGSFAYLDELWVSSGYSLETMSRVSPIPVVKIPLPVSADGLPARGIGRPHFGLQEGQRVFLFMCDAHSVLERKNPRALIRAFKRAFPDAPDARLVLKLVHGTARVRQELLEEAGDARVVVIDRLFDREEVNALILASDCYVSLHRAEGFGLTLAEAMALGKPVIATAYSSNLDFMNVANSYLVRYEMVRLEEDLPPYPRGSLWAEPDEEHAAELMRAVYDDPARARQIGQRARVDVRASLAPEVVGARMRERLAMIGQDPDAPGGIFK